jgi:hypothetical protein
MLASNVSAALALLKLSGTARRCLGLARKSLFSLLQEATDLIAQLVVPRIALATRGYDPAFAQQHVSQPGACSLLKA